MSNQSSSIQDLKPHERRHLRTRQAILDAARKLLREKGVNGVSLRAIAREIDYSPAGLYEYFDSKDDIIDAVCEEGHQRLARGMDSIDKSLAYPIYLRQIGEAYLNFARQNPDHFMLMFTTSPKGSQMEEFMMEGSSFPILISTIERGIEEGYFKLPEGGLHELAMILWSGVHGLAMLEQTQLKGAPLDFQRLGESIATNIFLGLMSRD